MCSEPKECSANTLGAVRVSGRPALARNNSNSHVTQSDNRWLNPKRDDDSSDCEVGSLSEWLDWMESRRSALGIVSFQSGRCFRTSAAAPRPPVYARGRESGFARLLGKLRPPLLRVGERPIRSCIASRPRLSLRHCHRWLQTDPCCPC